MFRAGESVRQPKSNECLVCVHFAIRYVKYMQYIVFMCTVYCMYAVYCIYIYIYMYYIFSVHFLFETLVKYFLALENYFFYTPNLTPTTTLC